MNCRYHDEENGWCKLHSDWGDEMPVIEYCVEGPCPDETPITNYDRIHAMSVEEKALWLYHGQDLIISPLNLQGIIDWLNSPAEGMPLPKPPKEDEHA